MPAKSLVQAQMMGIAHAIQKGEMKAKPGTPSAEVAKTMKPSDVTDFASTPQKGLPKKAKSPMDGGKMKMKHVGKPVKKMRLM